MASSTTLIRVPNNTDHASGRHPLPVAGRDALPVLQRSDTRIHRGAGLTINQVAIYFGEGIESVADWSFRLFGGPKHPASGIEKFFGEYNAREAALDKMYTNWDRPTGQHKILRDHCHKLLKFARSEWVGRPVVEFLHLHTSLEALKPSTRSSLHSRFWSQLFLGIPGSGVLYLNTKTSKQSPSPILHSKIYGSGHIRCAARNGTFIGTSPYSAYPPPRFRSW
ncbi:hypothetical protein B0H19DRAFT_144976 [Mycena capillaripes]|nr:hypothetical protein B0H19DRAFT_144976 [Mycena capillaripes]